MSSKKLSGLTLGGKYAGIQDDMAELEQALAVSGYAYDPMQDIFYSTKDAWQRDFGYCRLYDDMAATLNLIYDCEPIYFEYDDKRWLIELWKGQYGMTTGCEIGVYVADDWDLDIPYFPSLLFYNAVPDENCLKMACTLRKDGEILFERSDRHWWLTGFILGEFSEPSELDMDVIIKLKDQDMCRAFTEALENAGYRTNEIDVDINTVSFTFSEPYSMQPIARGLFQRLSQATNKVLCSIYRRYTNEADNMFEALSIIRRKSPLLYNLVFNIGKPARLFKENKQTFDMINRVLA